MNSSFWGYFLVMLGVLGIVIINISSNLLMTNEQDYYILKETAEAAMIDSFDMRAYREGLGYDEVKPDNDPSSMYCNSGIPGTIRIVKEKFVENFVRRFANNIDMARKYKIIINDIDECPPKVSITMVSSQPFDFISMFTPTEVEEAKIVNRITAIIEEYPKDLETDYELPKYDHIDDDTGD